MTNNNIHLETPSQESFALSKKLKMTRKKQFFIIVCSVMLCILSILFGVYITGWLLLQNQYADLERMGHSTNRSELEIIFKATPEQLAKGEKLRNVLKAYVKNGNILLFDRFLSHYYTIPPNAQKYMNECIVKNKEYINKIENIENQEDAKFKFDLWDYEHSGPWCFEQGQLNNCLVLNYFRIWQAIRNNDMKEAIRCYKQNKPLVDIFLESKVDHFFSKIQMDIDTKLKMLELVVNNFDLPDSFILQQIKSLTEDEKKLNQYAKNQIKVYSTKLRERERPKSYTCKWTEPPSRFCSYCKPSKYEGKHFYSFILKDYEKAKEIELEKTLYKVMDKDIYLSRKVIKDYKNKFLKYARLFGWNAEKWTYISHGISRIERLSVIKTRLRVARTALAVVLYIKKYGTLPNSLNDIVPQFLKNVPVDPFSGNPLSYYKGKYTISFEGMIDNTQRTLTGFYIYGIGRNLKDEKGDLDGNEYWNSDDPTFFIYDKTPSTNM